MKGIGEICAFMRLAKEDPRIGPAHISLYMAILQTWVEQGRGEVVLIKAGIVMKPAKIGGLGLYHRTIRQLNAYGYFRYEPSYNPKIPSRVILFLEED